MSRQDKPWPGPAPSHSRPHQGRPIGAVARPLALLAALFLLPACTGIGVIEKVASVVAKPILGLAVKDAKTTLAMIEREEKAGRWPPVDVELAKKCPQAVIALDALRTRMSEGTAAVDGFRGVIFYGTLNRYGRGVQAEAGRYLQDVATACLPLIPAGKLMKIF